MKLFYSAFLFNFLLFPCMSGNFDVTIDPAVSRYGNMLQEHQLGILRNKMENRRKKIDAITTRKDAQAYVDEVREKIEKVFGTPPPSQPLQPKIVSTFKIGNLNIERILFQSRTGLPVTALMVVCDEFKNKTLPAVMVLPGHSWVGKADGMDVCFDLANSGYAVFLVDNIGQGDRRENHVDLLSGEIGAQQTVGEHILWGNRMALTGESLASWMLWDNLSALEYLKSRSDIDPTRIGITGASGGGTMTAMLNPFADSQIMMMAPACYVTTFQHNFENEIQIDNEQMPVGMVAAELEIADLLLASPPRKILIVIQNNDFFDRRGAYQAYEEIKKIYHLLGYPEKYVKISETSGPHGYFPDARKALVENFNLWNGNQLVNYGKPSPPFRWTDFFVTPGGKTMNLPNARSVGKLIAEKTRELKKNRPAHTPDSLRTTTATLLAYEEPEVPHERVLRPVWQPGNWSYCNRYALEVEPGILTVLNEFSKQDEYRIAPKEEAILYVPNVHAKPEMDELSGMIPIDSAKSNFFAIQVRGTGESYPASGKPINKYFSPYAPGGYLGLWSWGLGRPLLGEKVKDVVAATKYLQSLGIKKIHLIGRGEGGLTAAFAALLYPQFESITLYHVPRSYEELATSPVLAWPAASLVPGILEQTDLPEIYEALKSQQLKIIDPVDAMMEISR